MVQKTRIGIVLRDGRIMKLNIIVMVFVLLGNIAGTLLYRSCEEEQRSTGYELQSHEEYRVKSVIEEGW